MKKRDLAEFQILDSGKTELSERNIEISERNIEIIDEE